MNTRATRILIVDEDEATAELIRQALATSPSAVAQPRRVSTLAEYVETVAAETPDLVFLDSHLPKALIDAVLSVPPENGAFPVVAMANRGDEKAAVAAIQNGAMEFLVKSPCGFADLPGTVDRVERAWRLLRERQKARKDLEESEARFRTLFQSAATAILVHDATTGEIVQANQRAIEAYGFKTLGELQRTDLWMEPPYSGAEAIGWIHKAAREGEQRFEWKNRDRHGRVFWEDVVLDRVTLGGVKCVMAVSNDITARKLAEEANNQQAGLINSLLDCIPDLIFYKDLRGVYLGCNPAFAAFAGRTRNEIIGKTDRDLFSSEIATAFCERDRHVLEVLKPLHNEEWVEYAGGRKALLETLKTPYRGPDGALLGVLGISRDITERKRGEDALRASEDRFRAYVDQASDPLFVHDFAGRFVAVNPQACAILGYTKEEMLQLNVIDIETSLTLVQAQALWSEIKPNVPFTSGGWHRRKDGTKFPVEIRFGCFDHDGKRHYLAMARDMSERHRAQEALRESERLLRSVIDLVPHFIFAKDERGYYLFANQACASANGFTPDQMIGRDDLDLVPNHEEAEAYRSDDLEVIESGRAKKISEERFTDSTGRVRILQTTKIPFAMADGSRAIMGVSVDITELKQTESALRYHRELLQETGHIAKVGGWEFDPVTGAGSWTDEVARIHDLEPGSETTVEKGLGFYDDESRPRIVAAVRAAVEQGQPYDLELGIISAKGVSKWVRTIGRPILKDDRVVRVMGSFQDITERRHLEAQVRESQKLEAVGQLAGGVAHDFNNILAAVMLQLGLVLRNPELDQGTREALQEVTEEVDRAAKLTRQLLMFSRRSVLAVRPLDLNDVMGSLLKMLRRLIGEDIQLRFEAQLGLPLVQADASMMEQVLMNFVVNSRDAMPNGGQITIGIRAVTLGPDDTQKNANRRLGRFVCLTVADTGCGMDSATAKRVFEPFFTTKAPGKGTGLGLATVYGIVAQHQGWLEVDSATGLGTTFRVYLPALDEVSEQLVADPPLSETPRGHESILLVEDEVKVRQVVAQTFRMLGYRVIEAANGQEAVKSWQLAGPEIDLLFTDMVMPEGMTGLELAERLRAFKPSLKAIISSGYSSEIAETKVLAHAGLVYLPKPYDIRALAEVVRRCLDGME